MVSVIFSTHWFATYFSVYITVVHIFINEIMWEVGLRIPALSDQDLKKAVSVLAPSSLHLEVKVLVSIKKKPSAQIPHVMVGVTC